MKIKLCITLCSLMVLAGCSQQSSQAAYIGEDAAKAIAFTAADISELDATFSTVEFETRDGTDYYAIAFTADEMSYRYDIDAITGVIIDSSQTEVESASANSETEATSDDASSETQVTSEDSDVSEEEVNSDTADTTTAQTDVGSDTSDSASSSTTAASTSTTAASTSTTTQAATTESSTASSSTTNTTSSDVITDEEAREIALNHAGLTSDQVTFIKTKLERDDGKLVYDIEFYSSDYAEYDYTIEAYTGSILSVDYDLNGYTPPSDGSSAITADEAMEIALAQVPGATVSNIHEFETDYDDGRLEYDGTIWYNGVEYEFTIDGYSGAIREWEVDY